MKDQIINNNLNIENTKTFSNEVHIINCKLKNINKQLELLNKKLDSIKGKENELVKNALVIGTTLITATISPYLRERKYDIVVVDEVSMAPCPNLYATCALATEKVILCGDFYQLSPIAECKEADWLNQSIFDKLGITTGISNNYEYKELAILDTQYRCHPQIANSIKDIVYLGKLHNGLESEHKDFYSQHLAPFPEYPLILVDTSRVSTSQNPWCEQTISKSWQNSRTSEIALDFVASGLESGIKTIGIITPYNAQAKLYKNKVKNLKNKYPDKKIEAATVHKYQGREMDMIIFDLVDCYPRKSICNLLNGVHGSEAMRLINVATTRARGKLIIIANVNFINQKLYNHKDSILFQWIQYLKENSYVCLL